MIEFFKYVIKYFEKEKPKNVKTATKKETVITRDKTAKTTTIIDDTTDLSKIDASEIKICKYCGRKFISHWGYSMDKTGTEKGNTDYCCLRCWDKDCWIVVYCAYCGKEMLKSPTSRKKFCNQVCNNKNYYKEHRERDLKKKFGKDYKDGYNRNYRKK
jgi:hypothetical protein